MVQGVFWILANKIFRRTKFSADKIRSCYPDFRPAREILLNISIHHNVFSVCITASLSRGENEWKSRRDNLSCLPSEPGMSDMLDIDSWFVNYIIFKTLKMYKEKI